MASNNLLAILLVIVLVVAVIGTFITIDKVSKFTSITGYGTTGEVNVTILNQTTINVTATQCNFGTGYVTAPYSYAVLNPGDNTGDCSQENDVREYWTNTTVYDPDCMEVRNDGNIAIRVNVSSGQNADGFIGGTSTVNEYKGWSNDKEAGACVTGKVNYPGVEMDTTNLTLCNCLLPENDFDELYVGCYLMIPDNAYGTKGDVWTFWAEAAEEFACVG